MQTVSRACVCSINKITENILELVLMIDKYRPFETGQFLQLSLEKNLTASDIWPDSRPFSICSSWSKIEKTMKLIIKRKGDFTNLMFDELQIGSYCTVKYPFGDMVFPDNPTEQDIIMIAGGTGIAPFLGFSEEIRKVDGIDAKLFYSVSTASELVNYENLKLNIGAENIKLFCTKEANDFSENRRIRIEDIEREVKNLKSAYFYICGSQDFINDFKKELINLEAENIFVDEWE